MLKISQKLALYNFLLLLVIEIFLFPTDLNAQASRSGKTIFENVNVFDGNSNRLMVNQNVLIEGNSIISISSLPITED